MKRTVLVLAAVTALVWTASAAAKECKPISGTFEATTVPCPAPLCTAGTLTGSLTSSYAFTMTSAVEEG